MRRTIWVGFDTREVEAFAVARASLRMQSSYASVHGVVLDNLVEAGLYTRPMQTKVGPEGTPILWDVISDFSMSTQFAISRFFVLELLKRMHPGRPRGWALFTDCDIFARRSVDPIFELAERNPDKALFCVHHNHQVVEGSIKMDGQIQSNYGRKNWSSVMLLNGDHPSNDKLTLKLLNGVPGRDLHRFCWLRDDEIGALDMKYNYLVGASSNGITPSIIHYTEGGPWLPKYHDVEYSDEWRDALATWALI